LAPRYPSGHLEIAAQSYLCRDVVYYAGLYSRIETDELFVNILVYHLSERVADEMQKKDMLVLTIGHSTRPWEDFLALLKKNAVTLVADIRTVPRSRHNPQYNLETLSAALNAANIGYSHLAGLGGFRRALPDSPNDGWRSPAFRGYADYMQTPEFAQALNGLIDLAGRDRVALLCAEAVPWRCHRSLVSDALAVRGIAVEHILGEGARRPHTLTPWARIEGTTLTYPPSPD
jgi:hypothetical protein